MPQRSKKQSSQLEPGPSANYYGSEFGQAPRVLADAMTAHPEMVSGEHRSDLELTQAGRGDWVAKIGAEGVQAIGLRKRWLFDA